MQEDQRAAWSSAYTAAVYAVSAPAGELCLRVGQPCPELDAHLRSLGLPPERRRWAHLTACNPRSRPLPPAENEHRMGLLRAALEGMLAAEGAPAGCLLSAEGRSPGGDWREAALWVAGLGAEPVAALARHFEQNAIVEGILGESPRLRWL